MNLAIPQHVSDPRHNRPAAIRASVLMYAHAHGLDDEQADRCAAAAVDAYDNGDSAAWCIALGKSLVREVAPV